MILLLTACNESPKPSIERKAVKQITAKHLDSLYSVWNSKDVSDEIRLHAMHELFDLTDINYLKKIINFYETGIEMRGIAKKLNRPDYEARALLSIGCHYGLMRNFDSTEYYVAQADSLLDIRNDDLGRISILGFRAWIHESREGKDDKYRFYLEQALKLCEENDSVPYLVQRGHFECGIGELEAFWSKDFNIILGTEWLKKSYHTFTSAGAELLTDRPLSMIARCYSESGNYEEGIENYRKIIDNPIFNGSTIEFSSLINIGDCYASLGQYDKAIATSKEALSITKSHTDSAIVNANLSENYLSIGQLDSAKYYTDQSLKTAEETGFISLIVFNKIQKGLILIDENKSSEAFGLFLEVLPYSKYIQPPNREEFYTNLYSMYKDKKDYKKALEMHEKALESKESLKNEENEQALAGLKYEFAYEKKAIADSLSQVEEHRIEKDKNDAIIKEKEDNRNIAIGGGVLLFVFIIGLWSRLRLMKKSKIELNEAKNRAEQSEAFKQQFLANMSHEIRTPMNAVMGMTNLVLDTPLQPKQKDYMQGIKKSSDNLLHIINDILDLSKIEAGKMELEEIDFSLSDTIDQVKQTLKHRATDKGLELVISIKSDVPDVVIGDPVRLNQVLINLTGNAIKFTEKGSVAIEVTKVAEGVKVAIVDTGIGIPADKLKSVFENFSQANASDTRKYGGTGLGLSISRQLVEQMGGNISIESEEGSGTTFSFIVNFKEGSAERLDQRMALERSVDGTILDGLKIMITDDNEYNRIVARDTLKSKANVEIFEAENGQQAIDLLKEHNFDAILMDIQMPLMNGFDATAHIRAEFDAPKKDTPIIALTASVLRTDLDKCKAAGMNSYIPKPFKPQDLITGIAQALNIELRAAKEEVKVDEMKMKDKTTKGDSVTDMTYLTDFCKGDKEKMAKYVSMFTSTAPALIEKITAAKEEGDLETIANQVHGFKTKWIMMGMTATKDMAIELEILCREEPTNSSIEDKLQQLISNINTAIKELA